MSISSGSISSGISSSGISSSGITQKPFKNGFFTQTASRIADQMFDRLPQAVDQWFSSRLNRIELSADKSFWQHLKTQPIQVLKQKALGFGRFLLSQIADQDYRQLVEVGGVKISQPPIGVFFLVVIAFTLTGRVIQAWRRGKEPETPNVSGAQIPASPENASTQGLFHGFFKRLFRLIHDPTKPRVKRDLRELVDILFRDIPALTFFVFLLQPLSRGISALKQRLDGMHLVHPKTGEAFNYNQFAENFSIQSSGVLQALVEQGHGAGLQKAAEQFLPDYGLKPMGQKRTEFKQTLKALAAQALSSEGTSHRVSGGLSRENLAQQAFGLLNDMEAFLAKTMAQQPEAAEGVKNFFVRYAKSRRQPVDIASFLIACVAIGIGPVVFNAWRNVAQFEKQLKAQHRLRQQQRLLHSPQASGATFWALAQSVEGFRQPAAGGFFQPAAGGFFQYDRQYSQAFMPQAFVPPQQQPTAMTLSLWPNNSLSNNTDNPSPLILPPMPQPRGF